MIKQLIQDLVYDNISLSQALTRAKLIAYKIKDENFKNWINNELNGYKNSKDVLPDYRIISCSLQGKIVDYYGRTSNIPIAAYELDKFLDGILYRMNVTQSISTLEESLKAATGPYGQTNIHPVVVQQLNSMANQSNEDYTLLEASQEIQFSQLQHIIDLTKQKLIDTLLELNDAFPNMDNEFKETKENIDKASHIITNNIYGSNNPLNVGIGDNLNQRNKVNIQVSQSFEELNDLKKYGVDEESIDELKTILEDKTDPEKEKSVAKRITTWLGSLSKKAIEKGVELQIPLIMERLSNYL
ncbi:hypothetical protein ACFSC6_00085 [Rufibacter sediminis]|uniref:AbiTii domain-containing protein n=1 Tax=Rufibacter sediminis TaxID=2762756 RepID=UPI00210C060C|nr:hypothetical protein [Rufibacter sediminis]